MSEGALSSHAGAVSHLGSSPLEAVAQEIEAAFTAGDFELTADLLERQVLEAWFALSPERLLTIMLTIESNGHSLPVLLSVIRRMMAAAASAGAEPDDPEHSPEPDGAAVATAASLASSEAPPAENIDFTALPEVSGFLMSVGRMYALRLQGRPVEALRVGAQLDGEFGSLQTLFTVTGGFGLFNSLQTGITAMLAGDFGLAETMFAEAKLHPAVPTLPFLTRDAHSKSAVLHACFGDPAVALAELALADQQPRTNSWIEPMLDAQTQLARALVQCESPEQSIEMLDGIPLNALGEMWPFFAYALRSVFERAGQPSEITRRLELLDQTRLPRSDGQGFTGSVLPSLLAFSALVAGNPARAKELWQRADPDLVLTKIGSAVFALSTGDAREGARITMELRAETRTLRQLEIWRLSVLASSLLLLDDREGCIEALRTALELPRGLAPEETGVFHQRVHKFAREHIADWPGPPSSPVEAIARMSYGFQPRLTPRELEMLQALARGLSREQIANELFLSINTVKAHQQTLYRKLGVSSKHAAVIEGERRGLL